MKRVSRISICALMLVTALSACTTGEIKVEQDAMQTRASLNGTAWWVEDISNQGVVDNSHTTLEFSESGGVAGDTSCNRYFGSVEITADKIKFGPLAGTRKACAEALMDQEARFYKAAESAVTWEIAETGLLHLRDDQGATLIRAFRISP